MASKVTPRGPRMYPCPTHIRSGISELITAKGPRGVAALGLGVVAQSAICSGKSVARSTILLASALLAEHAPREPAEEDDE